MSDALLTNINTLITQHLPAQVGDALQARLKQADQDAKDLIAAKREIAELMRKIQHQDRMDIREKHVAERETNVASRDKEVSQREVTILHKEEIAKLRSDHASARIADMKELTTIVFRSPVFKTSLDHTVNETVPILQQGGYVSNHNKSRSVHTEEVTRESDSTQS